MPEPLLTRYMQPLLAGRRAECFELIARALDGGHDPERIAYDVVWPAMAQVERLYLDDRIEATIDNMSCFINRTVVDQLQHRLPKRTPNGRRVLITSPEERRAEIGAQMLADLCQADGWEVFLVGTSVPHDELLKLVGELRPSVLMIYSTQPHQVPETRRLVELIREIGVCPTMNILASGGVFDRVDGLWQEVGADLAELCPDLPPGVQPSWQIVFQIGE